MLRAERHSQLELSKRNNNKIYYSLIYNSTVCLLRALDL